MLKRTALLADALSETGVGARAGPDRMETRPAEEASVAREPRPRESADLIPEGELEALYGPEYLTGCADPAARRERLEELRRRIQAGAYRIDADRIAEELLERGDVR